MNNIKILEKKEYNSWTIWNFPNKDLYHDKMKKFILKKLKMEMKFGDGGRKSNHLLEFGHTIEDKRNRNKFKCFILMTSHPNKKDYIFLNLIKKDPKIENEIDRNLKVLIKEKVEKYKQHYYYIKFDEKKFEINKRSIASTNGIDYDTRQYRGITIPGTNGGTMLVFKHKVEFLAYPGKAEFEKDIKKILSIIKNNVINY